MSLDTHSLILRFVDLYNSSDDSAIYSLYADEVEWEEMPSQRKGRRHEFFEACRAARTEIKDMSITPISITPGPNSGVLESYWKGTHVSSGQRLEGRVLWFFTYDEQGKICKETDYAVPLYSEDKLKELNSTADLWDA